MPRNMPGSSGYGRRNAFTFIALVMLINVRQMSDMCRGGLGKKTVPAERGAPSGADQYLYGFSGLYKKPMNRSQVFFRSALLFLVVFLSFTPVSAWTFSGWTGPSPGAELQPGSRVSAGYSLSFSSFESGTTFDSDNSLVMFTDLTDPHWVVVKTEEVNEEPLVTNLADRQSAQVRLDGWDLSFSRKQFAVDVALTGTAPDFDQTGEIVVLRLQELNPEAKTVSGKLVKKTAMVIVPTQAPTAVPTTEPVEVVIEITSAPEKTQVTTAAPVKKQTYAPGPEPLLICSLLAAGILLTGFFRHRH